MVPPKWACSLLGGAVPLLSGTTAQLGNISSLLVAAPAFSIMSVNKQPFNQSIVQNNSVSLPEWLMG